MNPKIQYKLTIAEIKYTIIRHDQFSTPILSPFDFANALKIEADRITKSVFLSAKNKEKYIMAICSCNRKLDLQKLAVMAQVNKLELATRQELTEMIGYPPSGVSAIAIPHNIAVFMDESLMQYTTLLTGAGEVAIEIELAANDLANVTNAFVTQIVLA